MDRQGDGHESPDQHFPTSTRGPREVTHDGRGARFLTIDKTAPMTTGVVALDQLTDQAFQDTGLAGFGDASWEEGPERSISGLNDGAALTDVGIAIARSDVAEYLSTRLRVVDWVKRNPRAFQEGQAGYRARCRLRGDSFGR